MPKLGDAYVELRAEMGVLSRQFTQAHGLTMQAASRMGSGFVSSFGHALRALGPAIGAVGVGGIAALAVREYAKLETGFARVHTMLSKEDEHFLAGMKQRIRELAVTYGQSTETISKGLYDILSAAVEPAKATLVLEVAMRSAVGGFTQTATAAKAIIGVLNAYGQSADQATAISDIMFAGVKRGQFEYEELAASIGDVISMASLCGVSFQQLMANLSTMTRQSIPLNEATHAYAMLLQAIIDPQDEAAELMRKLGIDVSLYRVQQEGMNAVLMDMQNLSVQEINKLGGRIRGFKALAALVRDQAGREKDLAEMFAAGGAAQEAYGKVSETTAQRLHRLKERLNEILASVGEKLVAAFERLEEAARPVAQTLGELFDSTKADTFLGKISGLRKTLGGTGDDFVKRLQEAFVQLPAWLARARVEMLAVWQAVSRTAEELQQDFWGKLQVEGLAFASLFADAIEVALTNVIERLRPKTALLLALPGAGVLAAARYAGLRPAGGAAPVKTMEEVLENYDKNRSALLEQTKLGGAFAEEMNRAYPLTIEAGLQQARAATTQQAEAAKAILAGKRGKRDFEAEERAELAPFKHKIAVLWAAALGRLPTSDEMKRMIELRPELEAKWARQKTAQAIVGPPQRVEPPGPSEEDVKRKAQIEAKITEMMGKAFFGAEQGIGPRATMGLMRWGVSIQPRQEKFLAEIARNTRDTYMAIKDGGGGISVGY